MLQPRRSAMRRVIQSSENRRHAGGGSKERRKLQANDKGHESIFLFPLSIDHDAFVETIRALRDSIRGDWDHPCQKIISAGFVDNRKCHGRSETLNKDSRGKADTALLTTGVSEVA